MPDSNALVGAFNPAAVAVRILDPFLVPDKEKEAASDLVFLNEYATDESLKLKEVLHEAGYRDISVHPTTVETYTQIIHGLRKELDAFEAGSGGGAGGGASSMVVLNLCDGTETDGYPGTSVLAELERLSLPYTGSDTFFYEISSSKPEIKRHLQRCDVPTSPFVEIDPEELGTDKAVLADLERAAEFVGFPLIVKPSLGYASLGIGPHSVCHTLPAAISAVHTTRSLIFSSHTFAERFLDGREFTVLIVGTALPDDTSSGKGVRAYLPAERLFDADLEGPDRMLQFDKYWKTDLGSFYAYAHIPESEADLNARVTDIALRAYAACGGKGYGRVDLRTTSRVEGAGWEIMVLEVNANPSLAFDPLMSTSGAILHLAKEPAADFLHAIVRDALARAGPPYKPSVAPAAWKSNGGEVR